MLFLYFSFKLIFLSKMYFYYFLIFLAINFLSSAILRIFMYSTLVFWIIFKTVRYYKSLPPGKYLNSSDHLFIHSSVDCNLLPTHFIFQDISCSGIFTHQFQNILGPWGIPLLGILPFLNRRPPHLVYLNMAKKYGDVFSVQMGSNLTVCLGSTKLMKEFFSRNDSTGRPHTPLNNLLGGLGKK